MLPLFRFRHRSARRGKFNRLLRSTALSTAVLLLLVFVLVPIVYRHSPGLQRYFLFLNKIGANLNFNKPEDVGLPGTHNFYLETEKNIEIGVWHILPESLVHSVPEVDAEKWFEESLNDSQPVILYLHGNKGSRGQTRRVELYNILRRMGYHIFAFDYRGYADSSSVVPSEKGLVTDAKILYKYIINKKRTSLVFVWGHSLGTGVACHAVSELCQEGKCPGGLVLEAPFNNIEEEVRLNPMTVLFRSLPYFDWAFINPLKEIDVQFQSDLHISHISSPILILHARDDNVVPFELGKKLQTAGQKRRPPEFLPIKFIEFEEKFGYGHNHIARAPELTSVIRNFMVEAQKDASIRRIHSNMNI